MDIKAIEVTPRMKVQAVDGQYRTVALNIITPGQCRIVFEDDSAMSVREGDTVRMLDKDEAIREALKALSEIEEGEMDWEDLAYKVGETETLLRGLLES